MGRSDNKKYNRHGASTRRVDVKTVDGTNEKQKLTTLLRKKKKKARPSEQKCLFNFRNSLASCARFARCKTEFVYRTTHRQTDRQPAQQILLRAAITGVVSAGRPQNDGKKKLMYVSRNFRSYRVAH